LCRPGIWLESIHVSTAAHPFLTENDTVGAQPAFWERLHSHATALLRDIGANTYFTGQLGDLIMGNWWDHSEQVAGLPCHGRQDQRSRTLSRARFCASPYGGCSGGFPAQLAAFSRTSNCVSGNRGIGYLL